MKKTKVYNNLLIDGVQSGRFLLHGTLAVLLVVCVLILGKMVVFPFHSIFKGLGEAWYTAIMMLALPFGGSILLIFGWAKFIEKRSVNTLGFYKGKALVKYLRGFIEGIGMLVFCTLILYGLGMVRINANLLGNIGISATSGVGIVLIGWLVQGASEEILMRGYLMSVVSKRHGLIVGISVSSLLFAILHLINPGINILSIINLALFGIFASLYAYWEESLWGICAFHASWNWMLGNGLGFEVSGSPVMGGMLINFDPVEGHQLFSGGGFGLEGGLLCTFILITGRHKCSSAIEYKKMWVMKDCYLDQIGLHYLKQSLFLEY